MNFFSELVLRLFSKTPHFFTIIKWVAIVISAITAAPGFLMQIGLDLPDQWDSVLLKAVSAASAVGAFVAQLTIPSDVKLEKGIED